MSIGLPGHLGPQVFNRALARSGHVVAGVAIAAEFLLVTAMAVAHAQLIVWPAVLALAIFALALVWVDARNTVFHTVAYVAIGGACTYLFGITIMSQYAPAAGTASLIFGLLTISLMFAGYPGPGVVPAIVTCVVAYAASTIAIVAAALETGVPVVPDVKSLTALCVVLGMIVLVTRAQRVSTRVQPTIHRAARDERVAHLRHRIEGRAAAVIHDTVLNRLSSIAMSESGEVSAAMRNGIERDLAVLVGEEWLSDPQPGGEPGATDRWQESALGFAVDEARELGLEVAVSGDLPAIERIGPAASAALGLAVKQCLVNVLRHADTTRAEVAVHGSESAVTVMVVDSGRGFNEAENGADRLGLRQSVRHRIEAVSGEVQVWSTKGRGTSIIISVPAESVSASAGARTDAAT